MSPTTSERLAAMDDYEVVRFLRQFGEQVFQSSYAAYDHMLEGVPKEVRGLQEFAKLGELSLEQTRVSLPPGESSGVARALLDLFAQDPQLEPVLQRALDEYQDEELFLEIALAVGFAASMYLIAATIEFEGELFGIKFKKKAASPEQMKAALDPFVKLIPNLG